VFDFTYYYTKLLTNEVEIQSIYCLTNRLYLNKADRSLSQYLLPSAQDAARYEGGPRNNLNLNVARELEIVWRCAATCRESTPYSTSLPRGVILG